MKEGRRPAAAAGGGSVVSRTASALPGTHIVKGPRSKPDLTHPFSTPYRLAHRASLGSHSQMGGVDHSLSQYFRKFSSLAAYARLSAPMFSSLAAYARLSAPMDSSRDSSLDFVSSSFRTRVFASSRPAVAVSRSAGQLRNAACSLTAFSSSACFLRCSSCHAPPLRRAISASARSKAWSRSKRH